MQIRITRYTVCDGRPVAPGQVIETDARQARELLAMQKAIPALVSTVSVETGVSIETAVLPSPSEATIAPPQRPAAGKKGH